MKTQNIYAAVLCLAALSCSGQNNRLTNEYKATIITSVSRHLTDGYVYADVARKMQAHLEQTFAAGGFDTFSSYDSFASALQQETRAICHDKHLRIRATGTSPAGSRGNVRNSGLQVEARMLENNLAYVAIHSFGNPKSGMKETDEAMRAIRNPSGIIIDLRDNTGGSPQFVQYACSYFFKPGILLNSLYWRQLDRQDDFYSTEVAGNPFYDVPVAILISETTFSGAEEFAYNMQSRGRAIIVGETSGGGAHPVTGVKIDNNITMILPVGRAINPVTGTNWEGTGVVPDVPSGRENALQAAIDHLLK